MHRFFVILFVLALTTLPLAAEGAGGVQFTQVFGRDLWPLPGGSGLPSETGQISSVGGFGYGVDDGIVMGGFGVGVSSRYLDLAEGPGGDRVKAFRAGYGGLLQGWQRRWGPLVGLFTTKVGFGGADWSLVEGLGSFEDHKAGFSLLGAAEAQMGFLVFPWFNLGLSVGMAGTLTLVPGEPFLVGYAPTLGLSLSWGSY